MPGGGVTEAAGCAESAAAGGGFSDLHEAKSEAKAKSSAKRGGRFIRFIF
jgi:hypothetical protein